jgi:hypothetical protein
MTNITIKLDCPECGGEGRIEVGPICGKPASMCCGGCYETHECEECDGYGCKEVESGDIDLFELVERYIKDYSRMSWTDCKLTLDDEGDFVTLRYLDFKQLTEQQIKSMNLPDGVMVTLNTSVIDNGVTEDGRSIYRYLYEYKINFEDGNLETSNQGANQTSE